MSESVYRLCRPRFVRATDLLSSVTEFAFRRLSASDQLKKIDELVTKYQNLERPAELDESDEDFRVKTVMELFSKILGGLRLGALQYYFLGDLLKKYSEEDDIFLFRQLGSNDQHLLIEKMLNQLENQRVKIDEDVLNRLPKESEEDFRLRIFTKLYNTYKFILWDWYGKKVAEKYLLSSGKEITGFPHAELWLGVSRIWFEMLSADEQGEHIAVLSRKLLDDEAKGKPPGEREADFQVRRFKELFEKLDYNSQKYLVNHIKTILEDNFAEFQFHSAKFYDGRSVFDNEIIKFINPHPRAVGGVRGATSSAQGGGGGGEGGQGTSSTTTSTQAS